MPTGAPTLRQSAQDWRWGRRPLPPASVADSAVVPATWQFPTRWVRSRPAAAARAGIQAGMLGPLLRSQLRIEVRGVERLLDHAAQGPMILAPNHTSHLDAPLVLTSLPPEVRRDTVTLAASDYFFDAWWRAAATSLVFNAAPVDRVSGGSQSLAEQLLGDGHPLLLFPEGTRSHDGYAGRFRGGAAHLGRRAEVSIVPIAIEGTWRAMPRGQAWPTTGRPRVRISFGTPLHAGPGDTTLELTRRLEAAIEVLLDEQRTDWWTSLRNQAAGTTPGLRGPDMAPWRRRWALLEPGEDPHRDRVWHPRRPRRPRRP